MATTDNDALVVKIRADIKSLQAGLRQAGREAEIAGKSMQKSFSSSAKAIDLSGLKISDSMRSTSAETVKATRAMAAAIGTAVIATGLATKKALDYTSSIKDTAIAANLGTDALQAYRFAAEQNGVSTEQMDSALLRLTKTIGDASVKGGEAATLFNRLGVSIYDSAGQVKSTETILREISDVLARVTSEQERASISAQLFGKEAGPRLVAMLSGGSAALAGYAEEAKKSGAIISSEVIEKGAAAGDQLDALTTVIKAELTTALVELGPALVTAAGGLAGLAKAANDAFSGIAGGIDDIKEAPGKIATLIESLRRLTQFSGPAGVFAFTDALAPPQPAPDAPKPAAPALRVGELDEGPQQPDATKLAALEKQGQERAAAQKERRDAELEAQRKHNEALIQQTREFVATETALEEMKYQTRRAALMAANAEQFGGEEAKNQLLADLATKHQENLGAIEAQEEARATRDLERTQELLDAKKRAMEELAAYTMDYEEQAALFEQSRYENALAILEQQRADELVTYEEFLKKKAELTEHYEGKQKQIREATLISGYQFLSQIQNKELRSAADYGAAAINIASAYSKKAFKLQKVLGIANAAMTAYEGANKALATGDSYTAILRAGAILAYGLANVAAISRTQMNGSVPGGGGGGSVYREPRDNNPGQAQSTNRGPSIALTLNGSNFSAEQVRQLIDQINEQIGDGANLG